MCRLLLTVSETAPPSHIHTHTVRQRAAQKTAGRGGRGVSNLRGCEAGTCRHSDGAHRAPGHACIYIGAGGKARRRGGAPHESNSQTHALLQPRSHARRAGSAQLDSVAGARLARACVSLLHLTLPVWWLTGSVGMDEGAATEAMTQQGKGGLCVCSRQQAQSGAAKGPPQTTRAAITSSAIATNNAEQNDGARGAGASASRRHRRPANSAMRHSRPRAAGWPAPAAPAATPRRPRAAAL